MKMTELKQVNQDKTPPCDLDAEKYVIGSLLIDGEQIYTVDQLISRDDFYDDANKYCFDACEVISGRGECINPITVGHELIANGHLVYLPRGLAYLSELISLTPSPHHIMSYARVVKNTAIARKAITTGSKIVQIGYSETDPNIIISECEKLVLELQKTTSMPKLIIPEELAKMALKRYSDLKDGKRKGVFTGYRGLDTLIGGLFGGELCYLGARPKMGKSEWLLSVCRHIASKYGNVFLASLEQPWGEVMDRWISGNLSISPRLLRLGNYSPERFDQILNEMGGVKDSNVYIYDLGNDVTGATINSIYSIGNHMKMAYGLSAIIVDQLSLVRKEYGAKGSLYDITTEISHNLKSMAMRLDVPVICACQINRQTELREDHRPQVSELRDSGHIEADADTILLLYREDFYNKTDLSVKGKAELIIGAQRQGGGVTGASIPLLWDKDKRTYKDVSTDVSTDVGTKYSGVPEQYL